MAQPKSTLVMIQNIYLYGPILTWAITMVALLFYKLDKQYPSIMEELRQRAARGKI